MDRRTGTTAGVIAPFDRGYASVGKSPYNPPRVARWSRSAAGGIFPRVKPILAHPTVQRTLAHRLTALLALAFFLFTWTGEALGAHGCAHHDAVAGMAAAAQPAAHGHHGAAHEQHRQGAPGTGHGDRHACTCQGTCPSVSGGALPPAADAVLRVAPPSTGRAAAPRVDRIVPRLVPFFLPYGQGPPLLG